MENLKSKIKPGYLYQISSENSSVTTSNIEAIYNYIDSLDKQGLSENQISQTISLRNYSYDIPVSNLNW